MITTALRAYRRRYLPAQTMRTEPTHHTMTLADYLTHGSARARQGVSLKAGQTFVLSGPRAGLVF